MDIAALVAWVLTAGGGFVMLGRWVAAGGLRQQQDGATRFPAALVFGHVALAAGGLVLWIVYLALHADSLAWVAFGLLVLVALLGFTLFARWLPSRQAVEVRAGGSRPRSDAGTGGVQAAPAEGHLPVPVIAAHGVFAVATLVLVLLTALQASS